jgi:hypothetical protein
VRRSRSTSGSAATPDGKITQLFGPGDPDQTAQLLLANAVYLAQGAPFRPDING